ncbi:hypothetical protein [Zhongshania sp.]
MFASFDGDIELLGNSERWVDVIAAVVLRSDGHLFAGGLPEAEPL